MEHIQIKDIEITGGFWKHRQEMNIEKTLSTVYKRFLETGRFDAFSCTWKEGMLSKPHIYWDSDVAKWIEGASYILLRKADAELERIIDHVVEEIEKNADENGYFNSYFLTVAPDKKWSNRDWHELYCAGHLIEAAVAYYEATGKDTFLKLMCRYADYIYQVFVIENSAAFKTPGHEEIELALVKLFRCTNNSKYLELAEYFVENRGRDEQPDSYHAEKTEEDWRRFQRSIQAHIPVREQRTAEGHSVRAMYLYSAMADLAKIKKDAELFENCKAIFNDIVQHKMYVTGGLGSTRVYEGFTVDYDLPSKTAYAESCAAIGMCLFADRMLAIEADSKYADVCELEFYNGFLSSTSLDGKAFFYENPLEIQPKFRNRLVSAAEKDQERMAITQRVEVFDCSCCPPNIVRFVPCFGTYMYTYDAETTYVHHFAESNANVNGVSVRQITQYPMNGDVKLSVQNGKRIAIRIPGWCRHYTIKKDGKKMMPTLQKGYAYIDVYGDAEIEVHFDMQVQLLEANPAVEECAGKVAVRKGVFIYCAEAVDNGESLKNLRVSSDSVFEAHYDDFFKAEVLETTAFKSVFPNHLLYQPVGEEMAVKLKLIPYYAFANRGESEMVVWLSRK